MRKTLMLFVISFLTLHLSGYSQTVVKTDVATYEKAKYLKEDLTKFLYNNSRYPKGSTAQNIQGEVFYSFVINKDGKLENLLLESSTDNLLSVSTYEALQKMENSWSPAKINNITIDKKYTVVFRYVKYMDHLPKEYKKEIAGFVKKQKYDKAIKLYDERIYHNPYDAELFTERSKLKKLSGDNFGAMQDYKIADKMNDEIMSVVTLFFIEKTDSGYDYGAMHSL